MIFKRGWQKRLQWQDGGGRTVNESVCVLMVVVIAEGSKWAEAWQTAKRIKYRSTTKAVSQGRLSHKSPFDSPFTPPPPPPPPPTSLPSTSPRSVPRLPHSSLLAQQVLGSLHSVSCGCVWLWSQVNRGCRFTDRQRIFAFTDNVSFTDYKASIIHTECV